MIHPRELLLVRQDILSCVQKSLWLHKNFVRSLAIARNRLRSNEYGQMETMPNTETDGYDFRCEGSLLSVGN